MVLILFIFVQNSHTAYFMNGRSSVCKNHRTCPLKYVLIPFRGPVTSRPKMDQLCRAILMKFERANFEGLYLRFRANFWDAVKRSVFLSPKTFIYSKILSSFHMVNLTFKGDVIKIHSSRALSEGMITIVGDADGSTHAMWEKLGRWSAYHPSNHDVEL